MNGAHGAELAFEDHSWTREVRARDRRRRSAAGVAALAVSVLVIVLGWAAPAFAADRSDALHNGYGTARGTLRCLDAETDSTHNPNQNGDKVQIWTCSGTLQQGWSLHYSFTDSTNVSWYSVVSDYGSRLCLDAENDANGNPFQNGDKVQLWTCTGSDQQEWSVRTGHSYGFALVNYFAYKCLDAETDSAHNPNQNGDKVQLWDCTYTPQQQWKRP
jgi:hypothetical protein